MISNPSWDKQTGLDNDHEGVVLLKIRDFVYHKSGLYFAKNKLDSFKKRLSIRVEVLELNSFEEYYFYLQDSPLGKSELQHMFDCLTNIETCFFRDIPQLNVFQGQVLMDLMNLKTQKGQNSLRIFSCGCATGEEPYTLAIIMLEKLGHNIDQWQIEIMGGDISSTALEVAQKGIYNQYSLRNSSKDIVNRYFTPVDDGNYSIKEHVRKMVHFSYLNLKDESIMGTMHSIDVIFCRNVLIYFSEEYKKTVVSQFYDINTPGGYLFIGPSESLFGLNRSYKLFLCPGALVYKKQT